MSVPNSTKNVKSEFSAKSQRKSFEYEEIKALMSTYIHLPASRIQRKLKEAGLPILPKLQITNFLNRERKKKRESAAVENAVADVEVKHKRGRSKKISYK
uniref:Uncharacterized protein n=1 Tax=Panagrolaimus davidi TaxID=227884 RepID=A0A914Q1H5_9BILA